MNRCLKNLKLTGSPDHNNNLPFLNLALPVMDEPELLPRLLDCISKQSYRRFRLYACVNQPDSWWDDPVKITACRHNASAMALLQGWKFCEIGRAHV